MRQRPGALQERLWPLQRLGLFSPSPCFAVALLLLLLLLLLLRATPWSVLWFQNQRLQLPGALQESLVTPASAETAPRRIIALQSQEMQRRLGIQGRQELSESSETEPRNVLWL